MYMPYKNKEDLRRYQRDWARRKRARLPTRTTIKLSKEERKQRKRESTKRWRQRKREEGDKVFGIICFLCNGIINLGFHKKDNVRHKTWFTVNLALKNPKEWVRLCYPCHKSVHWCMKHFDMTWENILTQYK